MNAYAFSKLIPGGNPTVILEDPVLGDAGLAEISTAVMSPLHLHAEQVGALYSAQADEWSEARPRWTAPRLEMMGGEFCVNAARSAAFILAHQGRLGLVQDTGPESVWSGVLDVSGATETVMVLASPDEDALLRTMQLPELEAAAARAPEPCEGAPHTLLYCAARVRPGASPVRQIQRGLWLARLPGMVHLLADARIYHRPDPLGSAWRGESAALRLMGGLADEAASGVVWFEMREGGLYSILPAVQVKATASEHLESACGSASLALALALGQGLDSGGAAPGGATPGGGDDGARGVSVLQPSGQILRVLPAAGRVPAYAWVAGPVRLAARGTLYL